MEIIIKLSPEITIKSDYVRKSLIRRLEQNLREGIKKRLEKEDFVLKRKYDSIHFQTEKEEEEKYLFKLFASTPGVAFFQKIFSFPLCSFPEILEKGLVRERREDTSIRITLFQKNFSLSCILYPYSNNEYILISCFKDY